MKQKLVTDHRYHWREKDETKIHPTDINHLDVEPEL